MNLSELVPTVDSVKLFSSNLADATKQVVVVINGERYTLSPGLSADFRSKKIGINDLGGYVVRDVVGDNGDTFKSLGYAGEDVEITDVKWTPTKQAKKVFSAEEFSAAVAYTDLL